MSRHVQQPRGLMELCRLTVHKHRVPWDEADLPPTVAQYLAGLRSSYCLSCANVAIKEHRTTSKLCRFTTHSKLRGTPLGMMIVDSPAWPAIAKAAAPAPTLGMHNDTNETPATDASHTLATHSVRTPHKPHTPHTPPALPTVDPTATTAANAATAAAITVTSARTLSYTHALSADEQHGANEKDIAVVAVSTAPPDASAVDAMRGAPTVQLKHACGSSVLLN